MNIVDVEDDAVGNAAEAVVEQIAAGGRTYHAVPGAKAKHLMKWLGIAFAILGLTLISVERFAADKKLTGNEIRSTHSGHIFRFEASTGSTGEISYKSDGTIMGKKDNGVSDAGKWWVKDDNYCRQWDNWRSGDLHCFHIFETGDKKYKAVRADGGSTRRYTTNIWMIK